MSTNPFIDNSPELQPYWEAAAQGRFLLPRCRQCTRAHWYPRGVCPHCLSTDIEAQEASGRGVVYSWTAHPAAPTAAAGTPHHVPAFVTLDEGPTLLTNIVGVTADAMAIGLRVQVTCAPEPGRAPVPLFRLA
ncbi:MAG: OB-fold domain-containing protein [Pseudomonadota bacterium]